MQITETKPSLPNTAEMTAQITEEEAKVELRCGICGKLMEVSEETLDFVREALKVGLDNPIRCEFCEVEYDDLVYEG